MSIVKSVIVGSSLSSGIASYFGAKEQGKGIKEGAAAEERISQANIALQRELTDQQREDFAPWRDVGVQALDKIWSGVQSGEFDVGAIDVTQDPGYQFRLDEGTKALDNSASSRGRVGSGAQQKAITEYAQNYGSNEYAKAYARETSEKNRKFNILSGLSRDGQSSAAGQASTTGQLATNTGNIMAQSGQNQNQAKVNQGTTRAGAYRDVATVGNQAAQNWLTYKMAK